MPCRWGPISERRLDMRATGFLVPSKARGRVVLPSTCSLRNECMVIEKIFEHARRTPGKLAISYGARSISYGTFAFWISHAREFLSQQALRS